MSAMSEFIRPKVQGVWFGSHEVGQVGRDKIRKDRLTDSKRERDQAGGYRINNQSGGKR